MPTSNPQCSWCTSWQPKPHRTRNLDRLRKAIALAITTLIAVVTTVDPAAAVWPFTFDLDQRPDDVIAAQIGPEGDLYVLSESRVQGSSTAQTVLLRLDPDGEIVWTGNDPDLFGPLALAVRPNGTALVAGRAGGSFRASSFAGSDGSLEWSRTRADVTWTFNSFGDHARPIWSNDDATWWVPLQREDEYAVIGYDAAGTPQPDFLWPLPEGSGGATAVRERPDGGFFVAGTFDGTVDSAPGWWTLAVDDSQTVLWSHFDDGDTEAGIFSGAFFLDGPDDELVVWADDETLFGVFSIRLWSLDPNTGLEQWSTTVPDSGFSSYMPRSVVRSAGRIVASGLTAESGSPTMVLSFDAASGSLVWPREFFGDTSTIEAKVASSGGSALAAVTHFPSPNPGPSPLWAVGWGRDGTLCAPPQELLSSRVAASLVDTIGNWYVVATSFSVETANDVLVQRLSDPCGVVFLDGFESGTLEAWSTATP